ncbi:hypothetical protein ACFQAT_07470 [Undibacterium arcticum]|uniref:hypothetical protein n=1 Tax=Undibacterium arcticum TaxID=1762892 RepID=UPI00361FE80E
MKPLLLGNRICSYSWRKKTARIFSVFSNSALDNSGSLLLFAFPEHRPAMQVKLVDLSS